MTVLDGELTAAAQSRRVDADHRVEGDRCPVLGVDLDRDQDEAFVVDTDVGDPADLEAAVDDLRSAPQAGRVAECHLKAERRRPAADQAEDKDD